MVTITFDTLKFAETLKTPVLKNKPKALLRLFEMPKVTPI